ncbi:MAG TPA: ATP-binding protein, partial [Polyangia bacterium]
TVELSIDGDPPAHFTVRVRDAGPGIPDVGAVLEGRSASPSQTGMGLGILGARRLVTHFQLSSSPSGTHVTLGKPLPPATRLSAARVRELAAAIAAEPIEPPMREMQRQNQELLRALEELTSRQAELGRLNRELEDTNRGVLALYSELEERAESLRSASELKSRFLSNMTHELRTPLNSILSLSRLLLDGVDGELNGEQRTQVSFVRRSAEDLSALVNDLLDLARIEAGKSLVRTSRFQLADVFGALRGVMKPLVTSSDVQLVFEDPGALPALHSDEGKVSQILRNLVANAIKFTDHGLVRVSAAPGPDGQVAISVADSGIGIAVDDQERIFDEFTQVDAHLRRKEGSGLGLPLCRKLATLLGGSVTVRSTPGRGSTFTLALPLEYRDRRDLTVEVQPIVDKSRAPVLIVEDDSDTLYVYESYLKGSGYQVLPARTIDDARQRLRQVRPAAIVLDVLLEGESTWLFLTELKQAADTRDIPVIVISVIEGQKTAIALGADDFCTKPVERSWLVERLTRLSGRGRLDKVLIVDDDEGSRYLLRTLISQFRFQLLEASGGVEGLAMARTERPGVIFLDLLMPDLSGFEVLEQLRADPATRDIAVIVFSSKDLDDDERRRLGELSMAVMPKGQRPEATLTDIKVALERAGVRPGDEP